MYIFSLIAYVIEHAKILQKNAKNSIKNIMLRLGMEAYPFEIATQIKVINNSQTTCVGKVFNSITYILLNNNPEILVGKYLLNVMKYNMYF